ncbi:MAG TPA: BON domain-containing protein [Desulfomicrobiaceae bacterium]|nr:BON domain-containing protein [Desulfomicrobiaceae bacterium]
MNLIHRFFMIFIMAAFVMTASACQQDQGGEGTVENETETEESIGEEMEAAGDMAAEKMDQAGQTLDEAAQEAGTYLDDSGITAQIKMDILRDPLLETSTISVTTTDGVVTLEGSVDSAEHADRAVQIATNIDSVTGVENKLTVLEDTE